MTGLLYDTSTHSATTDDWLQASKNMIISVYSEILPVESTETFTKTDFEQALGKVSRKRNLPIGEHIREAIDIIKRKDE